MIHEVKYRIIEVNAAGDYMTLFHGINGSRKIPKDVWLKAAKHIVSDGGRSYLSGFHVLDTWEECEKYLERFTKPRILMVIPIYVRGELRLKKHARQKVWLADEMNVPTNKKVDREARIFHQQLREGPLK